MRHPERLSLNSLCNQNQFPVLHFKVMVSLGKDVCLHCAEQMYELDSDTRLYIFGL